MQIFLYRREFDAPGLAVTIWEYTSQHGTMQDFKEILSIPWPVQEYLRLIGLKDNKISNFSGPAPSPPKLGWDSIHEVLKTCFLLVNNLFMSCSWLFHNLFTTFSQLFHNLSMTYSWLVHDLSMNCSWLAHDLLITCSWLSSLDLLIVHHFFIAIPTISSQILML